MDATANITRTDLLRVTLHMLFRARVNWIFVGLLAVCIFAVLAIDRHPRSATELGILLVASIAGGVLGLVIGLAFQLIYTFATIGKSGVLGPHTYSLSDRGIHETTEANDTIQYWRGVRSIRVIGNYILVQISPYLFHIVPKRAFSTTEAFHNFFRTANDLWRAA